MTACSFTGPRPKKLYGYNIRNKRYIKLSMFLENIIEDLIINKDVSTFISGGALGFDTIAFLTVNKLKQKYPYIKNILAIPFEKQDSTWNINDRRLYYSMKQVADSVVYVDQTRGYMKGKTKVGEFESYKMNLRNMYMVDNSDYLIALWDNYTEGGTYHCYNYAKKKGLNIIEINPNKF